MQETRVQSLDREDLLEVEMASHMCSCLKNPRDRGAWWATVHGVTKEMNSTEQASTKQTMMIFTFKKRYISHRLGVFTYF